MPAAVALTTAGRRGLRPYPPHLLPLLGGILALAAAMGIGRFAYTPLLPAMQQAAGLDSTQAGLLAAANYAGYLVGALLAAFAVPASGRTRILLVSAVGVAATTAMMATTTDLAAWSVIRFIAGLASAGVLVLASGLVLDDLRRQGRASLSGWLFSGVGLGIVISGVVVRLTAESLGWRDDWLLLALLATVAIYPCWRWLPLAAGENAAAASPPAPVRDHAIRITHVLLFAAYFLEGIGYIVTGTFLVAIVDSTPGLQGIGVDVWIVVGLAVIPSVVLWAALAGRAGYARVLAGAYLLQAVGIALPIAGGTEAAFASAVLFGSTFAGITALTLTLGGHLAPSRSARLIGMLTVSFGLGQMIGPVLGGVIANRAQDFTPALAAASVCVLTGGVLMASLQPFDPLRQGLQTSSGENGSTQAMPAGRTR